MMGRQRAVLFILLAQGLLCSVHVSGAGTGFIRVSDGSFVDEECNDFVATGLNT